MDTVAVFKSVVVLRNDFRNPILSRKGHGMTRAIKEYQSRNLLSISAFIPLLILQCAINRPVEPLYKPPIVFVGSFTGDYDSLPGNFDWPNTCKLDNDTIKMTFFSDSFKEVNNIRSGNFIRMDIFPCSTCVSSFTTKYVRFHMARYLNTNYSYEITPSDTTSGSDEISLRVRSLERQNGGTVDLYDIGGTAKALTGNLGLDLVKGRIFGSIE